MVRRFVVTPCCNYKQSTKQENGDILYCTVCKKPFMERIK